MEDARPGHPAPEPTKEDLGLLCSVLLARPRSSPKPYGQDTGVGLTDEKPTPGPQTRAQGAPPAGSATPHRSCLQQHSGPPGP